MCGASGLLQIMSADLRKHAIGIPLRLANTFVAFVALVAPAANDTNHAFGDNATACFRACYALKESSLM